MKQNSILTAGKHAPNAYIYDVVEKIKEKLDSLSTGITVKILSHDKYRSLISFAWEGKVFVTITHSREPGFELCKFEAAHGNGPTSFNFTVLLYDVVKPALIAIMKKEINRILDIQKKVEALPCIRRVPSVGGFGTRR